MSNRGVNTCTLSYAGYSRILTSDLSLHYSLESASPSGGLGMCGVVLPRDNKVIVATHPPHCFYNFAFVIANDFYPFKI